MNPILIDCQLQSLKDFLGFVSEGAGREWDSIEHQRQAGEFTEYEDWDAASDRPFILVEIAIRAVAYELVALTESELHDLAHEPWIKLKKKDTKDAFDQEGIRLNDLKHIKMASDLPFEKVLGLVQTRLSIRIEDVEGWAEIKKLRDAVNAFKHRRGMRRWRDIDLAGEGPYINLHHHINQEDITNAIAAVAKFLRHLQELTKKRLPISQRPN